MSFEENGKKIKLQGDPSLCKSHVSLKSLFKENKVKFMRTMFVENKGDLDGTKTNCNKVPKRLSLNYERDHTIPLLPCINMSNAKKNEIEKLIEEMLQAKIIQPNTSPYSSIVLLVKKKNWS
ncbi:hypothetical protein CR513_49273, partial [Mucuna pruriens]